jgi:activating signal cointegrator 1
MKAITLTQPWASLVAIGAKSVETRSWFTGPNPRGVGAQPLGLPLAIHAAKGFPIEAQMLVAEEPFASALRRAFPNAASPRECIDQLPRGAVIATAVLLHCVTVEHLERAPHILTPTERAFGNYSPGRFAWRLWSIRPLSEPIPARGHLGLWDWDAPAEVESIAQEAIA